MENFDNVYTVEMKTSKGWEVITSTPGLQQALNTFCTCDASNDGYQYRLTTPINSVEEGSN